MASEFRYRHRIEFAETDMAGIVHFSNYFRLMERTEHEFLRSLGLSVHADIDGRLVSWPRARAECSYEAPLTFEDEVEVLLRVRGKTRKSITYEFQFFGPHSRRVARGSITVVCATIDPQTRRMTSIPIPDAIGEKIETAPAEAEDP
ncbi:MAG: acyl-CoA thioesterase [Planctomycetes bacterium]|nr:acyl-CoA thioesterase [Planctomycetota bacterium]